MPKSNITHLHSDPKKQATNTGMTEKNTVEEKLNP